MRFFSLLCFYECLFNSLGAYSSWTLFGLHEKSSGFHLLCLFLPLYTLLGILLSPKDSLCGNTFWNILLHLYRLFFNCLPNFIQKVKPWRRADELFSYFPILVLVLSFKPVLLANCPYLQPLSPFCPFSLDKVIIKPGRDLLMSLVPPPAQIRTDLKLDLYYSHSTAISDMS